MTRASGCPPRLKEGAEQSPQNLARSELSSDAESRLDRNWRYRTSSGAGTFSALLVFGNQTWVNTDNSGEHTKTNSWRKT